MTDTQHNKAKEIKAKLKILENDLKKYQTNQDKLLKARIDMLEEKNGKWSVVDLRIISLDFSIRDFERLNDFKIAEINQEIIKLESEFRSI